MIGIKKNYKGFSLLEVLLATTIFVVVIILSSQIFVMTIKGSNRVNKNFLLQEDLKTFTESVFREIRMSNIKEGNINPQQPKQMFINYSSDIKYDPLSGIIFTDTYNYKTYIYLIYDEEFSVNRVICHKSGNGLYTSYFLTPHSVNVEYLRFVIKEEFSGEDHLKQPMVTIFMKARTNTGEDEAEMSLQTTVSTRIYE